MEALITYSDFADRVSSYSDESIVWTLKDIAEALQCSVANMVSGSSRFEAVQKYTEQLRVVDAERNKRVAAYRSAAWKIWDGVGTYMIRNEQVKALEAKAAYLDGTTALYN